MANPPCMSDDGNPAVFVGTMLQTGDAVALCDECMVPWCAAVLQTMTGIDATPFIAAISNGEPDDASADTVPAGPTGDSIGTPPIRVERNREDGLMSPESPVEDEEQASVSLAEHRARLAKRGAGGKRGKPTADDAA